jgi:iron complex outermembrane receptor protein
VEVAYTRIANANISQFNSTLKASKSSQYEVGAKWKNTTSRANIAAFHIITENESIQDLSIYGNTSYKNLPNGTTRKGVEAEFAHYTKQRIKLSMAASYILGKFNEFSYLSNSSLTSITGNKIPGLPEQTYFAEVLWSSSNFKLNQHKKIDGLAFGIDILNRSKIYADDLNRLAAPSYTTTNLKASYSFNNDHKTSLTLFGQINNIFDKRYIGSLLIGNSTPFEPAPGKNWVVGATANLTF